MLVLNVPWIGENFDRKVDGCYVKDLFLNGAESGLIGNCRGIILSFSEFSFIFSLKSSEIDFSDIVDYDEIQDIYEFSINLINKSHYAANNILNDSE